MMSCKCKVKNMASNNKREWSGELYIYIQCIYGTLTPSHESIIIWPRILKKHYVWDWNLQSWTKVLGHNNTFFTYNLSFCFSGFCLNDRCLATPSSPLSMLFTVSNIMYFQAYLRQHWLGGGVLLLYVNFCVNMNVRVVCPNDFCPRLFQKLSTLSSLEWSRKVNQINKKDQRKLGYRFSFPCCWFSRDIFEQRYCVLQISWVRIDVSYL